MSRYLVLAWVIVVAQTLVSCAAVDGYPNDPENSSAVLSSLAPYFDPSIDAQYNAATDPLARRQLRDTIVLNRMRAYDIEFDNFERSLYGDANGVSTGGDLVALGLNAAGATTGVAATKAALAAASGAVVGAQGAISKDLFSQRTIPALLSQMEANRATAKAGIVLGLQRSDSSYPLAQAYVDLETLKNAGGIPRAISIVTQNASSNAQAADARLQQLRDVTFAKTNSMAAIQAWLHKGGVLVSANWSKLVNWMQHDTIDPDLANIPPATFLVDGDLESDRQRAMVALGIPH